MYQEMKTVIYKFPHVSLDSFYEPSVVERFEDAVGHCLDFSSMYQDVVQTVSQVGVWEGLQRLTVKTIDLVGLMGLSVVRLQLIDDVKAVEYKGNILKLKQQLGVTENH